MSQLNFFHNTIALLPSEKIEREVKAINQNERILQYFKRHRFSEFTPAQVWVAFGQQQPLTSIRRGITDLTKAGDLVKTHNQRPGIYGEKNYTWKLNILKHEN